MTLQPYKRGLAPYPPVRKRTEPRACRIVLLAALLAIPWAPGAAAQSFELEYRLRIETPNRHIAEVEITASKVTEPWLDFVMPAWSPGRYAIYDFAKNVEEFQASGADGGPLAWTAIDKQTWRVDSAGSGGTVRVRYRVFANDLNGSFSQIDSTHANLNGASIYMYLAGHKPDAVQLAVEAPPDWKVYSGFSLDPNQRSFQAANYDRLIDTPMEIAPACRVEQFSVQGKTIRVVVHAYGLEEGQEAGHGAASANPESQAANPAFAKLVEGVKKIVASEMAAMPEPDFPHYTFLFHFAPDLTNGGDGMEHLNSTQIIVRGELDDAGITEALENSAHEFFHLWNVKRLRPEALGPFDYVREDYTRSLWFAEGVTSYFAYVHLLHSGLWTRHEFLRRLADEIRTLELEPGRKLMSAESSSFHAWFYDRSPQMQETNFANTTISYYNKGALLGMLLDLDIRARTQGRKSLDDVLRLMYQRFYADPAAQVAAGKSAASYYAAGPGYAEKDILDALTAVAGGNFLPFFDRCVRGTGPLPYAETLAPAGLKLSITTQPGAPPSLGATVQPIDRGVRIIALEPGGAAERAGLSRDDVLVSVDELSLATEELRNRLRIYPPGAEVPFTVERHAQQIRIIVKLDPPVPDQYSIVEDPQATPEEVGIRNGWLGKP